MLLGGLANEGQQGLGQQEFGFDVDLHHLVPLLLLDVLERGEGAEQAGIEQHAVEAAELLGEGLGHAAVVSGGGPFQIDRNYGRQGVAGRLYLVVDRLELGAGATEQHYCSAVGGIGERRFAADAVTGTRYQNDLVLEQIPGGLIIEHVHSC